MTKRYFNHRTSKKINAYFLLVLVSFMSLGLLAQAPKFTIKFKLTVKSGDMKNCLITITKKGAPYRVIDPDGSQYNIDLDLNSDFQIVCTKMGFITKTLIFDTHVPAGRETEDFEKFKVLVGLDPQPEDALVTYSQPVGKIQFSMDLNDFDYDKNYTQTALEMQKKAEEHPAPAPKPITPKPLPPPPSPSPPPPPPPKSNPIPVVMEKKEETHEKEKPKTKVSTYAIPEKPIEKNRTEKVLQEERKRTTIVTMNINGIEYVYKKEEYSWGGVYYYKGDKLITQSTFDQETQ